MNLLPYHLKGSVASWIHLNRFGAKVNNFVTGIDRINFKGIVWPIMHAAVITSFLVARSILNKDFKDYAITQSHAIVRSVEELLYRELGSDAKYTPLLNTRKESMVQSGRRRMA